jgi:type 1 fimbriae regulatory protein FimE
VPKQSRQSSSSTKKSKPASQPPVKPKNLDVRVREYLTPAEVKRLVKAAEKASRHGFRDALLVTMTYRHAFRVSEVIDLRWEQIDFRTGRMQVNRLNNGDASVHYLEGDELQALRQVKRDYPESDFVFASQRQGPLSARSVHNIVAKAGEFAGIDCPVHPHMLRHAKGYQLASRGEDIRAIQAYVGHKSIQNTVLYAKNAPQKFKGFGRD